MDNKELKNKDLKNVQGGTELRVRDLEGKILPGFVDLDVDEGLQIAAGWGRHE